MIDLSRFSDTEILALTALGESESLGSKGMQQTINTVINRVGANLSWMGGSAIRNICLKPYQYSTWNPGANSDRERVINIGLNNPVYGPYIAALGLAAQALAGTLEDITKGAVSYADGGAKIKVHPGSEPCLMDGNRIFYNLKAVA